MNLEANLETIRRVAAEVVAEIAPAEKRYFPVVWEEFRARGFGAAGGGKRKPTTGLFLDREGELKLVSPLVLFVVTEVYWELNQRFGPPEKDKVVKGAIALASQLGAPDKLAVALGERVWEKLLNALSERSQAGGSALEVLKTLSKRGHDIEKPECVAWFDDQGRGELKRQEGPRMKLEAQFSLQKSRFDIFVNCSEKGIWIPNSEKAIPLEPRIQRLLVLLLLHRGEPIAPSRVVRWAWPAGSSVIGAHAKKVRSNLKVAVSELKDELECVKSIDIPELQRDGNYCCQGEFTFCVLLPGWMDEQLASLGLRPKF
jgi:hypothetical protein